MLDRAGRGVVDKPLQAQQPTRDLAVEFVQMERVEVEYVLGSSQGSVQLWPVPWLISQTLSSTYVAGEHRLYLERNCRLSGKSGPRYTAEITRGLPSSKGLNSQRGFGPAVKRRRKSRPRSTSVHGSLPCKGQRLSTLRWDRLPSSRPPTQKRGPCRRPSTER